MAQNFEKESKAEKGSRFFRNFNALGAVALGGAAIVLTGPAAAVAGGLAAVNAAQAGGFEVARRVAKRRRTRKTDGHT